MVLEGDVRDCAKFALLIRSMIDHKYPLLFYDEAYSADVALSSETTAHDIIKRFMPVEEEADSLESSTDSAMTTITLRMLENVVKSLARIAPVFC